MTLPALPMGSIMAACMLAGALAVVATGVTGGRSGAFRMVLSLMAGLLLAAGAWQSGWYFPRHPTERWGLAALASGLLLVAGAAWCGSPRTRAAVPAARWPLAAGLVAMALLYTVTIVRL